MTVKNNVVAAKAGRFGTFTGVFTPNILTILGIILFLRVGWVVGQAGLWGALTIVLLANLISFLTGLSLSAIATSMDVRAGGNYYLISRSLGLEVGGAIGIPLYLSQAISIAFYIIGFTEALLAIEFFQQFDPRLIATAVALLFALIAYVGADFALRIQFFILAVLVISLISFFAGGWNSFVPINFAANYTVGNSFWTVFAVFFPAVTGIEVGISLSGDLKDPSKSIPKGTILSILVTAVIYILAVFWFASHLTADELINNNLAMQGVALVPGLILAGVWASTLSSALGSVLAAPRTLQAIAQDRVLPTWMAGKMGSQTEPRVAVLLSAAVAICVIWLGDLNFVAPIISMFFLNTYGMVNLVASIEKLVGNPSYRPRFQIPWPVSLLGAIGCYGAMFLISPVATVIAIVITYGVFLSLERRQVRRTWGDVKSGIWTALARFSLLQLETEPRSPKNWRPNLIVFTGQPHNREQLVAVADWLSLGRGIVTFFQLIIGDVEKLVGKNLRETARRQIRNYIQDHGMTAFAEAEVVSDFQQGALTLAQAHGIGNLAPNSILLGWSRTPQGRIMQVDLMRQLVAVRKSVLFLNYDYERGFGQKQVINVWWQGRGGNADLKLLLAYLIQQHGDWFRSEIRLLRIIDGKDGIAQTRKHLEQMLASVRVEAEPMVIVREDPRQPIAEVIKENSLDADLTLLGMKLPTKEESAPYSQRLDELVQAVGTVLLVRNAQLDEDLLTTGEKDNRKKDQETVVCLAYNILMTRPATFDRNNQTAALLPILAHIQSHLDADLSLAELADKAALSPYHFHRLFRDTISETPKQYTQRLRLERAAFDLKIRDATILEIALHWGFKAPETFTRAFKRWFGVTPKQYRASYGRSLHQQRATHPTVLNRLATETSCSRVTIQKLKPIPVAFIRQLGPYEQVDTGQYDTLIAWADAHGLYTGDNLLLGVGHDDPNITPTEKVRFDVCLSVPEPFAADGNVGFQTVPGGHFAAMTYIGPLDAGFKQVYHIFFEQLEQIKNVELIGLPVIEIYRTTRINPAYTLNETDIFIPVKKVGE